MENKLSSDLIKRLIEKQIIIWNIFKEEYEINSYLFLNRSNLGFEDVSIDQQRQTCSSRLSVDISSEIIKGIIRPIPMIAANMDTVCNADFCILLYKLGALGVLHRADTNESILKEIKKVHKECELVAGSLGTSKDQFDFSKEMIKAGCNILVIDVAHGYCDEVIHLAKKIKDYSKDTKVIVGNAINPGLLEETYKFVDAVKIGIAQGFACETKMTAGCSLKQISAILRFAKLSKDTGVPIISDGGVREAGDFVKSIAAGANSIMAGKIFAMCPESAAPEIEIDSVRKKIYAGMASRYVQEKWKGKVKEGTCTEGKMTYIDIGYSAERLIEKYSGALRSGITYSGARNIKELQEKVRFN